MSRYIKRNLENDVISASKEFPVVMVTGPRQVGKSTLLYHINREKSQVNQISFDDVELRKDALEDPKLFLEKYGTPLIIDEFQYVPELLSYIKMNVDKKRNEYLYGGDNPNGMYYLTGSQNFLSMKEVQESLAGRVCIEQLYGLSTREINKDDASVFIPNIEDLRTRKPTQRYDINKLFERIIKGSFPNLYMEESNDINKFYKSYINTYLERDIKDMVGSKNEIKFLKFMTSIAARTGNELNINEICNDVEINNGTANEWLSILKNTGLIYLLEPFTANPIKRVVKSPKIYFMDTGLACYLVGYTDSKILENSAFNGAIFETYVISEIIKNYTNNGIDPKLKLSYYRDNHKKEIDLIIDYKDTIYPIVIKKSMNPGKDAIKNFSVLKECTNKKISTGIVLCNIDKIIPIDTNNYFVPIEYI